MSRCQLVYSSITGNTRMVAGAVLKALPPDTVFLPVQEALPPEDFDLVVIGFWAHQGSPDPMAARYMERVRGRDAAFFGTMAAYPDSEHARLLAARSEALLAGNRILGHFFCQGKLKPERLARLLSGEETNARHPMTEERRARLLEAARHPDARDLVMAEEAFKAVWERHLAG